MTYADPLTDTQAERCRILCRRLAAAGGWMAKWRIADDDLRLARRRGLLTAPWWSRNATLTTRGSGVSLGMEEP